MSMDFLHQTQVQEIKKVFLLSDKDNNGTIDSNELKNVITTLAGVAPSPEDLKAFMEKLDSNKDGVISWEEFLASLTEWLQEEEVGLTSLLPSLSLPHAAPTRKTNASSCVPQKVRGQLHNRICSYFLQFKPVADFEHLRLKYQDTDKDHDLLMDDPLLTGQFTPEQKFAKLELSGQKLKHLTTFATRLSVTQNVAEALHYTEQIADILSVVQVFSTPEERVEIRQYLVEIFNRLQKIHDSSNLFAHICKFLDLEARQFTVQHFRLQVEAARVVAYFGPGPRIAHTPVDSPLHPMHRVFKSILVQCQVIPRLAKLLGSPCLQVREEAVFAIGQLITADPDARDAFLHFDQAFEALYSQIMPASPLPLLEKVTRVLAIFCGHTQPTNRPAPYALLARALPKLGFLFYTDQPALLVNVITCLRYLLPGCTPNTPLLQRLAVLLNMAKHPDVQHHVLLLLHAVTLLDIGPDSITKRLLAINVPQQVCQLLITAEGATCVAALELTLLYARHRQSAEAVAVEVSTAPVASALLRMATADCLNRSLALKLLSAVCFIKSNGRAVETLLDNQLVKMLGQSLTCFKEYDSVLREVYAFDGATYDFQLVQDVLVTLTRIMTLGQAAVRANESNENPYVKYFDRECLSKFQHFFSELDADGFRQMQAWREPAAPTLHDDLTAFLEQVLAMHQSCPEKGSKSVIALVPQLQKACEGLKRLEEKEKGGESKRARISGSVVPRKIDVAAVLGEDKRVFKDVPRDIKLEDILGRIQVRFGRPCLLQYKDAENERTTVDTADMLDTALTSMDTKGHYKFLLLAVEHKGKETKEAEDELPAIANGPKLQYGKGPRSFSQTKSLVETLVQNTKFTLQDVTAFLTHFQSQANGGTLNKEQFGVGIRKVLGEGISPLLVEQLFVASDVNKDGRLDFREFVCGLSVLQEGTPEERLRLCFKAYDLDGNGVIDRNELKHIVQATFRARGIVTEPEFLESLVDDCFARADKDLNHSLDFEEFKAAVLQKQLFLQAFWQPSKSNKQNTR